MPCVSSPLASMQMGKSTNIYMATLTQTAIITRKTVRIGIFFIIFLIVGKMSLDLSIKVYRHYFPAPPPPPTVTFGKLPAISFPTNQRPSISSLSVETATGALPVLSTQAKVYFMPKPASNLLSLDVARDRAKSMGFTENEEKVSETVYRFKSPLSESRIEMNTATGAFSISSDLSADQSVLNLRAPAPEIAAAQARALLSSAELLPEDLTGTISHEFLKVEDKNLVRAVSLSEGNFTKISFFRKSFDEAPSLTPDTEVGNVWFIVSGSRERGQQIIAGQYNYFAVDPEKSSTYPIKTAEMAINELTAGGGFIANIGNNPEGKIVVRKIYLAYFDPNVTSEFYEPIIALEGDNGFFAYVPAVTSDYYGE